MRNKSWPMWEDWKEIFRKDRAEGERVVDNNKAENKIYGTQDNLNDDADSTYHVTLDELFPDDIMPDGVLPDMTEVSMCHSQRATAKMPKKGNKKCKVEDQLDGIIDSMNRMHEETNACLKTISSRIGYDFDLSTKRTEVYGLLKCIPGLTLKQQFYMSQKLVKESELMDLFRGVPEEARPAYVMYVLECDGII